MLCTIKNNISFKKNGILYQSFTKAFSNPKEEQPYWFLQTPAIDENFYGCEEVLMKMQNITTILDLVIIVLL